MMTVQAPHSPRSQPFFAPVRCARSRSTCRSVSRGSTVNARLSPLSVRWIVWLFSSMMLYPVQNLLYVPYWPVSAPLCAAAGLSLTGEWASHILFFARGHILSRAGAAALEGPFFGMGNSILSILHKIKRLNYVEFIQLLYIMSQSGYQRFFQRPNGASPLVFLHIKKRHEAAGTASCCFFTQKAGR